MYSDSIEKLIKLFGKFPTVGPRTAARFVFYLIKEPKENVEELIEAIGTIKKEIKICPACFKPYEGEATFCHICQDPRRDKSMVCLVEKEEDLAAMEKTNRYKGLYFILGGVLGLRNKQEKNPLETRVEELTKRIEQNKVKEVILALNLTPEGQNTVLWLKRKLGTQKVRITQLGRGLPMGGELEYADEETLSSALSGRK